MKYLKKLFCSGEPLSTDTGAVPMYNTNPPSAKDFNPDPYQLMALKMIPGIIAEQAGKLETFKATHQKRLEEISYRFERWGDVLAIFKQEGDHRTAMMIPFMRHSPATLVEGHVPDMGGVGKFQARSWVLPGESDIQAWTSDPPRGGGTPGMMMLMGWHTSASRANLRESLIAQALSTIEVPNCATPEVPDRLVFAGIGRADKPELPTVTLETPAGTGMSVFLAILEACGKVAV